MLDGIKDVKGYVVEVSTNELGTDDILIHIGTLADCSVSEKEIKDIFRAKVRVAPTLIFHSPDEIQKMQFPQMSRKPIKFIDKRG